MTNRFSKSDEIKDKEEQEFNKSFWIDERFYDELFSIEEKKVKAFTPRQKDVTLASRFNKYGPVVSEENRQDFVIDMLRDIQQRQIEHSAEAVTKVDLSDHDKGVHAALENQVHTLKETITELQKHFEQFSARRRFTIYSIFFVTGSTLLLILKLAFGRIIIQTPWPELAMITSILLFVIARKLPERN